MAATETSGSEVEALRALRTAITFLTPDRPPALILVTSPSPAEGKTSLAVNLAVTLSSAGQSVALVDADLRRAALTEMLGLERAVGLSGVIVRTQALTEAMQVWGSVVVLPAGPTPPNPSELLGSHAMATLLEELAASYDVVIIDAPPVLSVTDAVVLAAQAEMVLAVVRYGKTTTAAVAETRRRLEGVGAYIGGVVLNAVPNRGIRDYYTENYESLTPERSS